MKKTILFALCFIFSVLLIGCNNTKSASNSTTNTQPPKQTEKSAEVATTKFEQFENGLTKLGLKFEKKDTIFSMIGAVDGAKYMINNDWVVELYKFDKKSDSFKAISENKTVANIPVKINGDMVLMDNNINKDYADKIYEIFNSLK